MARIDEFRDIIESVLNEYAAIKYAHGEVDRIPVFDRRSDQYLLMISGWDETKRVHGCLIHLAIIDGKIWIQRDGTEDGVATDLERAGIRKNELVLAFHHPDLRRFTEYALS